MEALGIFATQSHPSAMGIGEAAAPPPLPLPLPAAHGRPPCCPLLPAGHGGQRCCCCCSSPRSVLCSVAPAPGVAKEGFSVFGLLCR